MKTILTVLAVLAFATAAQAQTVVLDYDMSKTPDQQGAYVGGTCSTMWNATGTMLEHRGCADYGYAMWQDMFSGASTAQVDMRMRILESDQYAFLVVLGGTNGHSFFLTAQDFNNDTDWHEVTFFVDFVNNTNMAYIDEVPVSLFGMAYTANRLFIGDGGYANQWGNVDISLLKVTVDNVGPVAVEPANWSSLKSLYR